MALVSRRAEQALEMPAQHGIDFRHRYRVTEVCEAGHAIACIGDPARYNSAEVSEVRIDVEREAMQRHPAFHANADRTDLVLMANPLFRAFDPHADAILPTPRADIQLGKRANDPFLERGDK